MSILLERDAIVSATDLVKNFSNIRKKAKNGLNMIVFKNNKPDLAIIDIEEYSNLLKALERLEDLEIINLVEERRKNDNGVRYTLDDALEMRKQFKQNQTK